MIFSIISIYVIKFTGAVRILGIAKPKQTAGDKTASKINVTKIKKQLRLVELLEKTEKKERKTALSRS